ncbi:MULTISPECIES: tripartite tricarboxylate transporter substrate binding protein [unclassified Beijerinckia]|uniref:Bug family tripartite tricarboxylate transporter substrate binding protein n=1 Tax=unclassified Beijerinckia TaxID=2638183 RepID=UPI0008995E56|nr:MULTISPECIES: tripartite tricarboxylate transporter substrate binding protein [unclassified Beijerinckia]MDH7799412.1 tripartite-type tricarboxylate transporter receptor subunit TctC [Beijerinckia sp. GAS462]SED49513.1 Tripartite-type tricarboxylate transporter, receptor component TctC [Beijerinckia sp. 28-YEA-48]
MSNGFKMTRRAVVYGGAAAGSIALAGGGQAQDYPAQDLRLICAFPPGSGADVIVRYYSERLRPIVGRAVIVENRAGAGGNIAAEYAARAKPDGYTVYVHSGSALAGNMSLFKKPPVDVGKAFQVVATINRQPFMLVVDAKKPWKTVAELTAHLKEKGEKASYASAAPTGTVMGEMYKVISGVKALEVNYKNAIDSLNDMGTDVVDYGMHDPVFSLAQAREGRLRILAVSTGQRLEANPQLPTMNEAGVKGMDITGWWSAQVPAGTPRPVVDQLAKWFNQVTSSEETRKFLNGFGGDPLIETPEQAQARLVKDIEAWKEYVRVAKIEPQG